MVRLAAFTLIQITTGFRLRLNSEDRHFQHQQTPGQLVAWLAKTEPAVVCFQELKTEQGSFPAQTLRTLGYRAVWQGERSWNGVATVARPRSGADAIEPAR